MPMKEIVFANSMQEAAMDPATIYLALAPIESHIRIARESGVSGIEFLPTHVAHLQLSAGAISPHVRHEILSAHQSFRGEISVGDILRRDTTRAKLIAAASFFLLTEQYASLADVKKLRQILGKDIHAVAYPPSSERRADLYSGVRTDPRLERVGNLIFQPSARHIADWKNDPEKINNFLQNGGWSGLCLDLFHMREGNNIPWQSYLELLLMFTKEIHVAAGRLDSSQTGIDTVAELKALFLGDRNTEMSRILEAVGKTGWKGIVVTETPLYSLQLRRMLISPHDFADAHRRISQTIKGLLNV